MTGTPKVFKDVSLAVLLLLMAALSLSMFSCTREDSSRGSQEGQASHGSQQGQGEQGGGKTRTYYIAADPVDWDYAPDGISKISGKPFNDDENVFVGQGEHRIGKTYRKALYREYTDDSFSELEQRPEDQEYLGTLGPLIRAEVGDTIKVFFKNNTDFPASMHPTASFTRRTRKALPTRTAPPARRTRAMMWSCREGNMLTPGRSPRGRVRDPRTLAP